MQELSVMGHNILNAPLMKENYTEHTYVSMDNNSCCREQAASFLLLFVNYSRLED